MSNISGKLFKFSGSMLLPLLLLSGCSYLTSASHPSRHFQPAQKDTVNCEALKRQQIYNQSNMNMETNDTTAAQRHALDQLIAEHCAS